jgi:aerobic carbon-monoxide dehydrogenase large subunit
VPINPGPGVGGATLAHPTRPRLAHGKVRFAGEPVALVVAETEAIALEACELIAVEYDDLPVLVAAADAAAAGAPLLHDGIAGNQVFAFEYGEADSTEAAFAKAAHIVKLDVHAQRISGNPMEPKACLAAYDAATGSFDIYTQTQGMADITSAFAHVTGLAREKFRVHAHDVGGAFGVRNEVYPEHAAMVLATRLCARPVKWVGTREESIVSDHHARAAELSGALALDKDGKFLAIRVEWLINMGAYCSNAGPLINTVAAPRTMASNIYQVAAIYGHHRLVLTNTTPTTAYRGAGRPNVAYLWERLVDEAARITGIDRIELRRRNLIARAGFPYKTPTGSTYDSADPAGLLDDALAKADWAGFELRRTQARARGRLRGIGCAMFIEPSGSVGSETIAITFGADGTPSLYTLAGPSGQGYETVYQDLVGKVLGLDADKMRLRNSDPAGPFLATGTGSYGSRSLISHGSALYQGSLEVIEKGRALAADHMEASAADITFNNGRFVVKGTDLGVGLADLARKHAGRGGPHPLDTMTTLAVTGAFPSGAHISEVEIDPETGIWEIVNYVAVDDCGTVYNHKIVEGQMLGGLMQGIGQVMGEHCIYDPESGQLLTGSYMDYVMPRADSLKRITMHDRPVVSPANPLGAKGAGEAGATGSVPCLANAMHDALASSGVGHVEMPYTPARVWSALQAART